MNETKSGITNFLKNKNTVTIIGTMVAIAILFFGYNWRINTAITKVSVVVAKEDIQPRTKIDGEMVEVVQIAKEMYDKLIRQSKTGNNEGPIQSSAPFSGYDITTFPNGAYSNYNTMIPKGSFLIKGVNVVDRKSIPSAVLSSIPTGSIPYSFNVKPETTYGNSIMDGMYVDIYMKSINEDGKIMIGKLIRNVKVLAVLDSSGRNVFENTEEARTTATFIFGVKEEFHMLFRKASYLEQYGVELIPVPITKSIDNEKYEGSISVASKVLEDYIKSKTEDVPEDQLPSSVVPE